MKLIKEYLSFYAGPWECYVDGEKVQAQDGDFYGGWVTSELGKCFHRKFLLSGSRFLEDIRLIVCFVCAKTSQSPKIGNADSIMTDRGTNERWTGDLGVVINIDPSYQGHKD